MQQRGGKFRSQKQYFIVTSLVSFLEVFCMAGIVFVLSNKDNVECRSVSSQQQTAILVHKQQCDLRGTNYNFSNHTFTECNILNIPSSTLPAEVYRIINDENARLYAIIVIAVLLLLRVLSAWILYESIWGSRCANLRGSVRYQTQNRRKSEAMFRGQQYGRAISKDRTKTSDTSMRFNRMATSIAINRKRAGQHKNSRKKKNIIIKNSPSTTSLKKKIIINNKNNYETSPLPSIQVSDRRKT